MAVCYASCKLKYAGVGELEKKFIAVKTGLSTCTVLLDI